MKASLCTATSPGNAKHHIRTETLHSKPQRVDIIERFKHARRDVWDGKACERCLISELWHNTWYEY